MIQAAIFRSESPLLESAIAKLSPGIFSHPVWVRFGNCKNTSSLKTIHDLFTEADKLLQDKPDEACQVLFVCAVFQHYGGQSTKALNTLQKIQELAEKSRLNQELICSLWGSAAVCYQQGLVDTSVRYLAELQSFLSMQDEWVLADFVDVVQQAMGQPEIHQAHTQENLLDGSLTIPFQWLNTWGISPKTYALDARSRKRAKHLEPKKNLFFSLDGWRSLRFRFAGELKVLWTESHSRTGLKRVPFWEAIINRLRNNEIAETTDLETIKAPAVSPEIVTVTEPTMQIHPFIDTRSDPKEASAPFLSISVHMLGPFRLTIQDIALNLPSSRSLSLLKYLLLNHKQNTPREMLIDLFWSEVSMERGRNNLNVAMNGIRTALRMVTDTPVIHYRDNAYGFVPDVQFWLDVEEFEQLVASGRRCESQKKLRASLADYESAISLYQGDFLEENPYENWTVLPRERLRLAYLDTLDRLNRINFSQEKYAMCITLSQLILSRDRCREDAHCMLMRCYSRQRQDHLALRQYQACVEALHMELDVAPAPETVKIYDLIRHHKPV